MEKMVGKRFIFAMIAMACVTTMAIKLSMSEETILKLVGLVCGVYLTSQSVTDLKKGG